MGKQKGKRKGSTAYLTMQLNESRGESTPDDLNTSSDVSKRPPLPLIVAAEHVCTRSWCLFYDVRWPFFLLA